MIAMMACCHGHLIYAWHARETSLYQIKIYPGPWNDIDRVLCILHCRCTPLPACYGCAQKHGGSAGSLSL